AVLQDDLVAKLPDRTAFAGSVATADRLLRTMVKEAGVPLPEASRMLSETPARVMGYTDRGRIAPGQRADLVLLNDDYQIQHVIWKGELIK
ncbi:MAG: N-acetylglucosamine-6-phosphate deacetylase, partial [Ruminococcaceae bacterium]|nr:N-acetylglucosamine-6-phosphate deacetylase [Oscillospiraceae bacterium]